jgi:DNA-binding LytR/AlgR family response regulator
MKILIIEDEPLAIEQLENIILGWNKSTEIVGVIDSVEGGIKWFEENEVPDLILSDVQLSDGISIEIFKKINKELPLVFITAFDHYAIDAFKYNAIDYLLKPIDAKKLHHVLDKVFEKNKTFGTIDYQKLADLVLNKMKPAEKRFLIKFSGQLINLSSNDVVCFYTHKKMVMVLTSSGKKIPIDESLEQLEKDLDNKRFFRVNRGVIINANSIKKMVMYSRSRIKLMIEPMLAEDIIVSREKTPLFKNWLLNIQ